MVMEDENSEYAGYAKLMIAPFDAADHSNASVKWAQWSSMFKLYIDSTGIKADVKKKALLLLHAGERAREIHEAIGKENDKYEDVIKALTGYFKPVTNTDAERLKFREIRQGAQERFDTFLVRLRQASKAATLSEEDIKAQILYGCRNQRLRRKAMEKVSSFEEVCTLARSLEFAEQQTRQQSDVNIVDSGYQNKSNYTKNNFGNRSNFGSRKPNEALFSCKFCGRQHEKRNCPAYGKKCRKCDGKNHFAAVCNKSSSGHVRSITVDSTEARSSTSDAEYTFSVEERGLVHWAKHRMKLAVSSVVLLLVCIAASWSNINCVNFSPELPIVKINMFNTEVDMLVDTGSTLNIINESTFEKMKGRIELSKAKCRAFGYDSLVPIEFVGEFTTVLVRNGFSNKSRWLVSKGDKRNVMGYKVAENLKIVEMHLDEAICHVDHNKFVNKYQEVFSGKIGRLNKFLLKLFIDKKVVPVAQRHRHIPFHMREKVAKEVQRMVDDDVIEPVKGPTEWLMAPVIVPKKNGQVRLVVDARPANKAILRARYVTPTVEELFNQVNGAKYFSKVDLKSGFHQIELDEASRYITVFSTHVGVFRYKRLNMGISCASEIFQHIMETKVLHGLNGIRVVCDDILIYGKDMVEHDERVDAVLRRLRDRGMTVNPEKCVFGKPEVEFYGMVFSADGIQLTDEKVKALKEAKTPSTPGEVSSLIGLATYCSKFIPNLSSIIEPLRKLTRIGEEWKWNEIHEKALQQLKEQVITKALAYFDTEWQTEVVVDASPVGVGAVLIQRDPRDKSACKIVAYASKALSDVERRYSHIEKEGYAAVWGCEKFHMYLYGQHFKIVTDNKSLEYIFKNPKSKTPARIERWCLRLSQYNFDVEHRPGKYNPADYLSRNPISPAEESSIAEEYVNYLIGEMLPKSITREEMVEATKVDEILESLKQRLKGNVSNILKTKCFDQIYNELSVSKDGIVMRGTRIVVPEALQARIIKIAHDGHQGITKTKQLLRSKVWFVGIDRMAEDAIDRCEKCQINSSCLSPEPACMSEMPEHVWENLAIDFYGPFLDNKYLMVVIDEYSRYPIVKPVKSTAAENIIPELHEIFSTFGIPKQMKSDNGPPFNGEQYDIFLKHFGVKRRKITPLHPRANAEVERFMKNITKVLKNASANQSPWKRELNYFLSAYRATKHSTTGVSPNELLFKFNSTARIGQCISWSSVDKSDKLARINDQKGKSRMKVEFDKRTRAKGANFKVGDTVLYKWQKPKVSNKSTPNFDPRPYVIKGIKNSMVTCERDGRELCRNSSLFKKFITDKDRGGNVVQEENLSKIRVSNRIKTRPDRLGFFSKSRGKV